MQVFLFKEYLHFLYKREKNRKKFKRNVIKAQTIFELYVKIQIKKQAMFGGK